MPLFPTVFSLSSGWQLFAAEKATKTEKIYTFLLHPNFCCIYLQCIFEKTLNWILKLILIPNLFYSLVYVYCRENTLQSITKNRLPFQNVWTLERTTSVREWKKRSITENGNCFFPFPYPIAIFPQIFHFTPPGWAETEHVSWSMLNAGQPQWYVIWYFCP